MRKFAIFREIPMTVCVFNVMARMLTKYEMTMIFFVNYTISCIPRNTS